jgi:hypothetical protein
MKKLIIITMGFMIIFSNGLIANANEENARRLDGGYITTEEILFTIIKPQLDRIVKEQYGKEMIVNPMKVNDIYYMEKVKSTKGKDTFDGWVELNMFIMVGERKPDENFKMDGITLKINVPNIGGNAPQVVSDKIDGIQVELVNYYKHK